MDNKTDNDQAIAGIRTELKMIRLGMRRVFISVAVLTLMVILLAVAVMGSLVNYFGGDALLVASASVATAVIGFLCGWIARQRTS